MKSYPWPGIALAVTGAVAMLFAGAGVWLTLSVLVVWIGSLWAVRPHEIAVSPPADITGSAAEPMRTVIEPVGFPLILLKGERIVLANAAARNALGAHIVGQDARIVLRHPEAIRLLELSNDESVTVPGFTGGRSLWQLTRRAIDSRFWLIELLNRTAEADVSRAHTDFVANASHELRTPLAAIIGYVETLVDAGDAVDGETVNRFHETVLREARRMEMLVGDLISLSQVEAEKHDAPTDELDLGRLVERVAGEVRSIFGSTRVQVSVPEDSLTIRGDRVQLEQLVRNLVDNALKYGDAAEPVRVTVAQNGGDGVLGVADRGPGISSEHLPHLTRRFYRTDPGRSRAAGGTGLGLAIVKHIVERHRGTLDITSEPGVGTTVTVTLPAVSTADAHPAAQLQPRDVATLS
ncbi:MAG: ATP-binding protein [Pseudomonadota bacterium]